VNHWEHTASIREAYETYLQLQVKELMTNFGQVDLFFIDSEAYREEVKAMVWEMQPNCIITRGAILTPEQFIPGETIDAAWESNMTMGTQWNYKPTNEYYKSGTYLINALIKARARGGSFLLNVGPDAWGNLNEAQQGRLIELAAWNFVNGEAITEVRPWIVSNEGDIWLARHKSENKLYAYITGIEDWKRGDRKSFLLRSVKSTEKTRISVLGQSGNVVEYKPEVDGRATFDQTPEGLTISMVRAQRIYNNHLWPNPVVVKLELVVAALVPVKFVTVKAEVAGAGTIAFKADVKEASGGSKYQLCFEYRHRVSSLDKAGEKAWERSQCSPVSKPGEYATIVTSDLFKGMSLAPGEENGIANASAAASGIEYRAVVIQEGMEILGNLLILN
jgi:alpha-L-fucosidase